MQVGILRNSYSSGLKLAIGREKLEIAKFNYALVAIETILRWRTVVETQPPEIEGKQAKLIRLFPGIYMNPEEFETEKRPRQESNLRHQL